MPITRTDVKIGICKACGRYGLIDTEHKKCYCEHNHVPSFPGRYNKDCRKESCKRKEEKRATR